MTEQPAISTLTLRHRIPGDWAADPWAEVRPLVDGVDVLGQVHPAGLALSCRHWTGPAETWPLAVTEEPRRIMITEPVCTAGCCGALFVTMRREGGEVVWDSWENTSDMNALPGVIRFDAAQYEAELARAAADRGWEEPVDTVARLLEGAQLDSGWFERWGCVVTAVWPSREEPDTPEELGGPGGVEVEFREIGAPGKRPRSYGYELPVTHDRPPEVQARRLAARILADDPRKGAEIREP
ncbi:hypothetical protein LZP81_12780 [Streptomyces parvulus]|uniref:hypothetical protein n=1 Tax=Streptomyces parvulus TaxID=146923 RepID=UPI001E49D995|nr:hypothetical protein [Streptomyces parvulus]MCC9155474.1 hypothetical protein [Streptomyces parvulus]MCE7687728.1 hypothetical protein [Streptomyces parvulus]